MENSATQGSSIDGTDRKSLDILVNEGNALIDAKKNCQESTPKYKQLSTQTFPSRICQRKSSRATPERTKPRDIDKFKNSKVIKKINPKQPSSMTNTSLKRTKPELENVATKEAKPKEKAQKIKPKVSDSLERNNSLSLEYILEYKRKYEKNKAIIDYLTVEMEKFEKELLERPKLVFSEPEELEVLDCKHLTDSELKQHYESNKVYLDEIFHGKTYCSRHELFHKKNFNNKDLRYNTSFTSYTCPQRAVLLDLLGKQFPNGEILGKHDHYFFKVLLPVLCKKIFMEVHNMSSEDAGRYLATGSLKPIV